MISNVHNFLTHFTIVCYIEDLNEKDMDEKAEDTDCDGSSLPDDSPEVRI